MKNGAKEKSNVYLITSDLAEMMESYERVGLNIPDRGYFQNLQKELTVKMEECVGGHTVRIIAFNELINKIAVLLKNILMATPDAVIISTVQNIAAKLGGHCVQINRIVDCHGSLLGTGSRPSFQSVFNQFSGIKGFVQNRPVILVEDGSFSGGTTIDMIETCRKLQIKIDHIVAGLLFPAAKKNILNVFPNASAIHAWLEEDFVDWVPDHDFYPFTPNSGRVVGARYNEQLMPVYLHNGLSLTMPYILPYGRPTEWASINKDKQNEFSVFCLGQTLHLFEELESLNKQAITLEFLTNTYPRVSLPVTPGTNGFPHIKTRVIEILNDDMQMLS